MKIRQAISGDRPRLTIPRTPLEQGLTLAAAAGALGQAAYLMLAYANLPDRVPMHSGFDGTVDSWGPKATLFAFPAISLAMFIGMELTKLIPHYYNYPWPVTSENAERFYRISREMVGWIQAEIVWLFAWIMGNFIAVARAGQGSLDSGFMIVGIALPLATAGVYTYFLYKNK
jgi:hypothetical protein